MAKAKGKAQETPGKKVTNAATSAAAANEDQNQNQLADPENEGDDDPAFKEQTAQMKQKEEKPPVKPEKSKAAAKPAEKTPKVQQDNDLLDPKEDLAKGTSIEQKEQTKIIVLRSVYGKTQGMLKIRPAISKGTGRLYTGQGIMSDDEKRKAPIVIEFNTALVLSDGYAFDLSDPIKKAHWEWVKVHPYIAKSFDEAQEMPTAMFYVEDLDADMDKKATKRDVVFQALQLLNGSSAVKKGEVMRLLGQTSKFFNERQVNDFLGDLAMNAPQRIIDAFKDRNYKTRLFLYRLIDKGFVDYDKKVYKYEDTPMGITEEQAIEWLNNPANAEMVIFMRELMDN